MKKCTKCGMIKEITEFFKDSKRKDGLKHWCKDCCKEDNRKREPKYKETRKKYRINNQKEYRENKKTYYKNNKESILSNNADWRQTLNGRLMSYRRGAASRNLSWDLSKEEFSSFWNKPCYYCTAPIETIGLDRINSKKGYFLENLVPCCYQCNMMKMDYTQEEFLNKIENIWENIKKLKGAS